MKDVEIGDVLVHRLTQTLWAVIEIEPDLILRDPYGLVPDRCMPAFVATTVVFGLVYKFAWHHEEATCLSQ